MIRRKKRGSFRVNFKKKEGNHATRRLMTVLAISFGVLTSLVLFLTSEGVSISGYSILTSAYGGAAPVILVVILILIIALYSRVVKN